MNKYLNIVTIYRFELAAVVLVLLCTLATIIISVTVSASPTSAEVVEEPGSEDEERNEKPENGSLKEQDNQELQTLVVVDISGAVTSPALYEMKSGSRIGELIDEAGGLNAEADKAFVSRNINLAKPLVDGEKIHVPSLKETSDGIFLEKQRYLTYLSDDNVAAVKNSLNSSENESVISINQATVETLIKLEGVGEKTAEKIIENRPYSSIDELVTRDVLSENGLKKIQSEIGL